MTLGSHKLMPYEPVLSPKYKRQNIQTVGLRSAEKEFLLSDPVAASDSFSSVVVSQERSSSSTQEASLGVSARTNKTITPKIIAGRPSIRNNHCHPARPPF